VRGVANADLTPELAMAIGRALGLSVHGGGSVLVGRDTRRSGEMLEAALAAGIASAGDDVVLGGVLPTPAVAELVAADPGLAAGVVISASHNPFPDNGIKIFGPDGFKLPDEAEAAIEALMADAAGARPTGGGVGSIRHWPEAAEAYRTSLIARTQVRFDGLRLVVDCAHGATVTTATQVLSALGADLTVIGADPDGVNINVACGSTDLGALQVAVRENSADLGLAFDGDGDRVLAVDATGAVVDGDQILAILAIWLRGRGELPGDAVVTTTMTNLGFRRAMAAEGIEVRWTDVGDRYVLAHMREHGFVLGGEQSGHLIHLPSGPTGDGLGGAILLLSALAERGMGLADAAAVMERMPQRLVSIRVERKGDLAGATEVWNLVTAHEADLGDDGRIVLRASGTEPLVRVMVEAPTSEQCESIADEIAEAAGRALGLVEGGH
jgi:phosphoglucosamine mutase